MKKLMLLIILGSSVAFGAAKKPGKKASNKYKDYGTSHAFNSANIKGKVQEGNMRRIVVENDKSLEDLLGIRKSFDDRQREEGERY